MSKIIWGLVLIGFGVIFLAKNNGWLDIDIGSMIINFWPLVLIIVGLTLLAQVWRSVIFKIFVVVMIVALFALPFIFRSNVERRWGFKFIKTTIQSEFGQAKNLYLSLKTGAVELVIDDRVEGNQAFRADLHSQYLKLKRTESRRGDGLHVGLETESSRGWFLGDGRLRGKLGVGINKSLIIDQLRLDVGASAVEANLASFNLKELKIDSGASTIDLILGDLSSNQKVSINSGASTLNIRIPQSVGVQLTCDGVVSSKNFPSDFQNIARGLYQSTNYGSAEKKIVFDMDLGAATLNIDRLP